MKLFSLNSPARSNRYCGPAILSFLTGQDTSECASWFRRYSNHRGSVRGSSWRNMLKVLAHLNFDFVPLYIAERPTLARWLRENKEGRTPGRVYLVCAGNHWQLITGRRYACGRIGELVSIKDKRVKRRARVERVWELKLKGKLKIPPERDGAKDQNSKPRAKAKRLEAKYMDSDDIGFENQSGWEGYGSYPDRYYRLDFFVSRPEWLDESEDPYDGAHYCYNWEEVVDIMEAYVALIGTDEDSRKQ